MKPYQYYIDDILGAVYSPETADPDFLRDSAAMYAEACAEVNDRLRNVARFLNRGLRSEAIQLAEQEPNLLETFSLLDFQELPAWRQMLVNWGMAEPPNLLVELAGDLNRAYAEHQPIETLLRRHRLLALSRAPLAARISHLRRLVGSDPSNDTWATDLEALEEARVRQIDGDLQTAARQGDLSLLQALYEETKDGQWSVQLPTGLAQKVETQYRKAAAIVARKELEQLDLLLNQAHMAFDVDAGRSVREKWLKVLPVAHLSPNDPLLTQAQPALAWLVDADHSDVKQEQFEKSLTDLESALENEDDIDTLRRHYNTCLAFEWELPELLRHRVEQRLASHELAATRKRRLLIGGVLVVLVLLAGGLTYWMVEQSRAKSIATAANTMQQLVGKEDFSNAADFYAKLPEYIATSSELVQLKSQLDSQVAAETKRQADFQAAFEQAQAAPRETPDRQAIADAKQLAKTSQEQEQLATIEEEIAEAARQMQREQSNKLLAALAPLLKQLQGIETSVDPDQDRLARLKALRTAAEKIKTSHPQASPSAVAQVAPLLSRINALRDAATERLRQAESLERITAAVGNADGYWQSVEQFAQEFPNSSLASALPTLQEERKFLEGLLAWRDFLRKSFVGKRYFTAEEAQRILKEGTDLKAIHPDLPLTDYMESRRAYLESVTTRTADGAAKLDDISRLFRDPLIRDLYMVKRKSDSKAFYSRDKPVITDDGTMVEVSFITGFDLGTKKRKIPVVDTVVTNQGTAPQSVLAKTAQECLSNRSTLGWEASFCKILRSIMDSQLELDPILRMILLQRILETATTGSTPLAEGFKDYRQTLEQANVDLSVPWMSPDDELAVTERNRAEVLIRSLPPIEEAIRSTAEKYKELVRDPEVDYAWIGWLTQDAAGNWTCQAKDSLPKDGQLMLIHAEPGSKRAAISPIGRVAGGRVDGKLILSPIQRVVGRPILLKVDK